MFFADRTPVVEHRRLEHDAVVAVEPRPPRRLPVDGDVAVGRLDDVPDDPEQRGLPAPRRPDQRDELASLDLQVDALERPDTALAEDLREALDRDDGGVAVQTSRSGARCTTTFSATSTTRKKPIPSNAA